MGGFELFRRWFSQRNQETPQSNMWEFDIVHVPGKKNVVADALSRRPEAEGWEPPDEPEEDIEDFIDGELNAVKLQLRSLTISYNLEYSQCSADTDFNKKLLDDTYSAESQEMAAWIQFWRKPERLSGKEWTKFKKDALKHIVREK